MQYTAIITGNTEDTAWRYCHIPCLINCPAHLKKLNTNSVQIVKNGSKERNHFPLLWSVMWSSLKSTWMQYVCSHIYKFICNCLQHISHQKRREKWINKSPLMKEFKLFFKKIWVKKAAYLCIREHMLGPASFPSNRELSQQKAFSELIFMLISVLTHVFKLSFNTYPIKTKVRKLLNYNTNALFKRQ